MVRSLVQHRRCGASETPRTYPRW